MFSDSKRTGRMISVLFLGFSSGLPLLLIGGTLKAWLANEKIDLALIGLFAFVQIPYAFKFVWSPIFDRYSLPILDRRRGWILFFQVCLTALLVAMAFARPAEAPAMMGVLALLIAFCGASQDIVIDAYRREILTDNELGLGSTLGVTGYRISNWVASGLALIVAGAVSWQAAYLSMAALMGASTIATVLSPKSTAQVSRPANLLQAAYMPLVEYFRRKGAVEMLLFILLFKMGDQMASEILNPFYIATGFDLKEIGAVSKTVGMISTIAGGFIGGFWMLRVGILKSLFIFGIFQSVSTLGFSLLTLTGPNLWMLGGVVALENVASGMGTAAYVAFMGSLCDRRFTATQYALLSSLMGVPRAIFGSASGVLAKSMGWGPYFVFCTLLAIPGIWMLMRAKHWQKADDELAMNP